MILRPVLRRSNGLQIASSDSCASSCLKIRRTQLPPFLQSRQHPQRRSAHSVPSLGSREEDYQTSGLGELFSPSAFSVAWTQYQGHVVQRLNDVLAINGDKRLGPSWNTKQILLSSARDPAQASIFNYASMAHNNHFFFQTLSPTPIEISPEFETHINRTFSSIDTLKAELLTTAASMFGPGFVWLVQHRNPSPSHPSVPPTFSENSASKHVHLRILVTYLAGSPYPGAHNRQQGQDMNVQNRMSTADGYRRMQYPQNSVGSFGPYGGLNKPAYRSGANGVASEGSSYGGMSKAATGMDSLGYDAAGRTATASQGAATEKPRYAGADVVPLLCVNTWQHCYLNDFGVTGKMDYLEKWWDAVDWNMVWANADRPSTYLR